MTQQTMQVTRLLIPSNPQSSGRKNMFYVLGEDNPECLTLLVSLEICGRNGLHAPNKSELWLGRVISMVYV